MATSAILLLPMLSSENWQTMLEYQRLGVTGGEFWRLISGHLVHLGWGHLLMNLLGFWLIYHLFFRDGMPETTCIYGLIFLTLSTSAGLFLLSTSIDWYRGFSGILHGLLVWALLREIRQHPTNAVLLLLLIAKLIWEQLSGPIPGSEAIAKGRVIVDAHLYGGLSGALLWSMETGISKIHMRGS